MEKTDEKWELDFKWLRVKHLVKDSMGKEQLPDLNAILYLIGIQELGRFEQQFTKEEKQDLMHIAVCKLLSYEGYYEFKGRDADGWPHYETLRAFDQKGLKTQERILKETIIRYFEEIEAENGGLETK